MAFMLLINEPVGQRAERGEAAGRVVYQQMLDFTAELQQRGQLMASLTMFGRRPVGDLAGLLPYAKHIHGKFYGVDASGNEPSLPYPELFAVLKNEGFSGTISAEWEGHAFTEEPIGIQQVQAWKAMCERLLAD